MAQMWNQLIGDDCYADIYGVCSNAGLVKCWSYTPEELAPQGGL